MDPKPSEKQRGLIVMSPELQLIFYLSQSPVIAQAKEAFEDWLCFA